MRPLTLLTRSLCLILPCVESAAQPGGGPAYARNRGGGMHGGHVGGGWRGAPIGGHFGGYGFFPYQPTIAGSWYARPYPYHFDYYRWRYSMPPQTQDCPCPPAPVEQ